MQNLQYWLSDSQLADELIENLKQRELGQKFLYMNDGASSYYEYSDSNISTKKLDYLGFFLENFGNIENPVLISLGCGNGGFEKEILEHYATTGKKLTYLGVDSSRSMLEKAQENLKEFNTSFDTYFVCSDFMKDDFAHELRGFIGGKNPKIFSFLGSSFSNPNQTSITDSLYNILGDNDYLWFDIPSRESNDQQIKMKLFDKLTAYLTMDKMVNRVTTPLRTIGIDPTRGKIILESDREVSIGAIVFTFKFLFEKKTVIKYRNQTLHFLPDEKLKLLSTRNYLDETLIHFFVEHDFTLKSKSSKIFDNRYRRSQFIFSRT